MSILDQRPACADERLWLVRNEDGTCEVVTDAEKAGRGGFAPPWGQTYRAVLNDMMRSIQSSTLSWLQFHAAYLKGAPTKTTGPLGAGAGRGGREMDAVHFVANGHTYTAYIGVHHKGGFLGFGGARVTITMASGETYESNNLWSGRDVPPVLREVLHDNATIKWH
jgi:hypothetical protein